MFRRTSADLPKDPFYPADLSGLGYRLNEHGQIVDAEDPSQYFFFYHTDNDRANEVRKEAMHTCVRKIVRSSLDAMGVKQLYVNDDSFIDTKPEGPHTQVLTTELEVLKNKKDVIVVVNEHMQDLGIWAYRLLMREAGIDGGSAVGLVKKLQAWGSSTAAEDAIACGETVEKAVKKLKLDGAAEVDATTDRKEDDTPGLIILNPGQLIYSNQLNESMAQPTWMARPKKTAIDDHIRIDPVHNRMPGHENPEAHVSSVFEHVIRKITREDVRLYVVGLSEGGEAVLKYLDSKFMANTQDPVGDKLEAIALIQPNHIPSQLKSESLANLLAGPRARSWIMDDAPKGTLLNTANSGKPLTHYADSLAASKQSITDGHQEGEGSATSTSGAIAIPPKLDGQAQALNQSTDSLLSSPRSLQANASLEKGSYSFPQSAAAMLQSVASLQTNGSGSGSGSLEQSQSTLSQSHLLDQSKDSLDEPDPYADTPVSCATFSSGELQTAVPELVWPAVMDDVLEWFNGLADDAAAQEARSTVVVSKGHEKGGSGFA